MPATGSAAGKAKGTRSVVARWVLDQTMRLVGGGAVLFLCAGRIDWGAGWAYQALTTVLGSGHCGCLDPWQS